MGHCRAISGFILSVIILSCVTTGNRTIHASATDWHEVYRSLSEMGYRNDYGGQIAYSDSILNLLARTDSSDSTGTSTESEDDKDTENRSSLLFSKIEERMKHGHLYRDTELTLEKAAKAVSSNRTYLSAAIKKSTGLSFSYYVNSYRIKEAMNILSDPTNREPLKTVIMDVGFKSQTPFYRLFNEATGTTPTQWRERHAV